MPRRWYAQARYQGELAFYPGLLPLRAAPFNFVYLRGYSHAGRKMALPGQTINQLLDRLRRRPGPPTLAARVARRARRRCCPRQLPDGSWRLHHATEPQHPGPALHSTEDSWLASCWRKAAGAPVTLYLVSGMGGCFEC